MTDININEPLQDPDSRDTSPESGTPAADTGKETAKIGIEIDLDEYQARKMAGDITEEEHRQFTEALISFLRALFEDVESDKIYMSIPRFSKSVVNELGQAIKEYLEKHPAIQALYDEIYELKPHLNTELCKEEYGSTTIDKLLDDYTIYELLQLRQDPDSFYSKAVKSAKTIKGLYDEIDGLNPYLNAELCKEEYGSTTIDKLLDDYTIYELLQLRQDPDSFYSKAVKSALIKKQQAGRDKRHQLGETALKQGALMSLHSGNMPVFSQDDLWDAFAPSRISKIGTLNPELIDKKTGRIKKTVFDPGEIISVSATDYSLNILMLLNTILANSVENYREYFIKNEPIPFYVKGILDSINVDPRIKNDGQLDFNRKTAGVLYLEKQLEPFLNLIGTTPNGSRYSVLNYEGYDAESDTMIIRSPYLQSLWNSTQETYFKRKEQKKAALKKGKTPTRDSVKPIELNLLFPTAAYKEDATVLEIAIYVTNVLLNAGVRSKTTKLKFKTIIQSCPRLREKLDEISARPNVEYTPDGKKINNTARFNTELRKIAKAFNLIMDPNKCYALKEFDYIFIEPSKTKAGKFEFTAPTKSTLDNIVTIKWSRTNKENEQNKEHEH